MKTRNTLFTLLALVLIVSGGGIFADEVSKAKAVLVTGASSGIGLQIVETLSRNGFYVYAGARKAEDLKMLDAMDNVSAVRLNVTVDEDIEAAVDFVKNQGRGLWGIVNNAGPFVSTRHSCQCCWKATAGHQSLVQSMALFQMIVTAAMPQVNSRPRVTQTLLRWS
jgi:NAD(P)-dependent dehydrogenase (short-subunit alcohol dehydrogenase family)